MSSCKVVLDRLDSPTVSDDGRQVSFRVCGVDREAVEIGCDHADLLPLIAYLIGLGGRAATAREGVAPQSFGYSDKLSIEPIQASDVGLMRDMESSELVLVARLFGFDLSFTVTPHPLAALLRSPPPP